jgi:hypothetical protein
LARVRHFDAGAGPCATPAYRELFDDPGCAADAIDVCDLVCPPHVRTACAAALAATDPAFRPGGHVVAGHIVATAPPARWVTLELKTIAARRLAAEHPQRQTRPARAPRTDTATAKATAWLARQLAGARGSESELIAAGQAHHFS